MILWLSDLHLNFCSKEAIQEFGRKIAAQNPDAVLISGDIAEYPTFDVTLFIMCEQYGLEKIPTYFVLGNHDCYKGSYFNARGKAKHIKWAKYLTDHPGYIELNKTQALIGHDGWYDGRCGNYSGSDVQLLDFFAIDELKYLDRWGRKAQFEDWADEAANNLKGRLVKAVEAGYPEIICVTHVPPSWESAWYRGHHQDINWAPFFCNDIVLKTLRPVMEKHPEQNLIILCGHTHGAGFNRPIKNIEIHSQDSEYGDPKFVVLEDLLNDTKY